MSSRLGHTLKGGRESVMEIEAGSTLEMNLHGNLTALAFYGDGGNLSNLVTDLQSVTESSDGVYERTGREPNGSNDFPGQRDHWREYFIKPCSSRKRHCGSIPGGWAVPLEHRGDARRNHHQWEHHIQHRLL